jgi:hypothetical protein
MSFVRSVAEITLQDPQRSKDIINKLQIEFQDKEIFEHVKKLEANYIPKRVF